MWTETANSYSTSDPNEIAAFCQQTGLGQGNQNPQEKEKGKEKDNGKEKVGEPKNDQVPWWNRKVGGPKNGEINQDDVGKFIEDNPDFYLITAIIGLLTPVPGDGLASLKSVGMFTKSSLQLGNKMHKAYKAGLHNPAKLLFKEFILPSGRRIDFLDASKGIIYELKPFNPRSMTAGQKQLNMYMQELQTMPQFKGINWKTVLDTY